LAIKISIAGLGWWGKVMIERLSHSNKLEIVNLIDPFPDQEALKLAKTHNLELSLRSFLKTSKVDQKMLKTAYGVIKNLTK